MQRLTRLIYPLPSAGRLGRGLNTAHIQGLASDYGRHMKALHVDVDLAPDADLGIPGYYIASLDRAFSADPGESLHAMQGPGQPGCSARASYRWSSIGRVTAKRPTPTPVPPPPRR